jgi:glycosyltransferase involved in cell wall biosynthesis
LFGEHASKIRLVGPLQKEILYAVIAKSIAVVLPSLADNLPNAAIESLLLKIPVIGTYDSSIDELVQHGVTGLLVARNSEHALAAAILEAWNAQAVFSMDSVHTQSVFLEMQPANAVKKLLCLDFEEINAGT